MHGSGLLIVNPPWHAQQAMQQSLNWISENITDGKGAQHFGWLVPE
ncbi:MAG: 23S rRNA (adenine(2030)-N(6))-methyltransferase RlmJ [Mariprofundus sp.]